MNPIDLLDPQHLEDPYRTYARLRSDGPVVDLGDERFLVADHATVTAVLRDHETYSSESTGADRDFFVPEKPAATVSLGSGEDFRLLIRSDPPDHTRLRQLVRGPFTPSAIARLEPRVRAIAHACVDDLMTQDLDGNADFVRQVAFPLPVIVIAELLGIPPERRSDFKRWSDNLALSVASTNDPSLQVAAEMFEFFDQLVAERRGRPGEDLVSRLLTDASGELTTVEIVVFCELLLIAGNETTTNLLGSWVQACFDHPEAAAALRADRDLAPSAIEEALRYDSPVQGTLRRATRDTELGEMPISRGARLLVLLGAANRDPAVFPEPDRFDPRRNPTEHVAFGSGIHFCLGAGLSRLEARVLADVARTKVRSLRPSGPPTRTGSALVRGFQSMPVRVEPA